MSKKRGKKYRRFQVSYEHFLHSNSQKSCKQNWHFQNEWTEKQIYISGCSILLRRWQFIQSLNVKPKCIMTLFIMDWKLALFVWVVGFFSLLFKFKFTKKFLVYYIDWFLYVARLFAIWFYLNVFVVVITLYYFIFCLLRSIYFACDDFKKNIFCFTTIVSKKKIFRRNYAHRPVENRPGDTNWTK